MEWWLRRRELSCDAYESATVPENGAAAEAPDNDVVDGGRSEWCQCREWCFATYLTEQES